MKTPSKKVLEVASIIITEGEEGIMLNAGKPNFPSQQDVIEATALLNDYVIELLDNLGVNDE